MKINKNDWKWLKMIENEWKEKKNDHYKKLKLLKMNWN